MAPSATFKRDTAAALAANGWRVLSPHRATREYRGGILAILGADGTWEVLAADRTQRGRGHELTGESRWSVIGAAMDANETAWRQPEYAAAKYAASEGAR